MTKEKELFQKLYPAKEVANSPFFSCGGSRVFEALKIY